MNFSDWVRIERISDNGKAEIGGRRIYILPTKYGVIFGFLLFLMLLGAVNYGNNPAHLLTFLLVGLGSNAIYLTWRNLRALQLQCKGANPVFAGEEALFSIELTTQLRARPALQLMFEDGEPIVVDLNADSRGTDVRVPLPTLPRGRHLPGRLVVSTRYPFGLFRAWCYIDCDRSVLIYPKPGHAWDPPGTQGEDTQGGEQGSGSDDFAGLRGYHPGDQPSQIDWKSFARDRGLNTRLFSGQAAAPLWFNWKDAPGGDNESRISALTRAVVDAERKGNVYGLSTPEGKISPGLGPAHRHQCLSHLATYGYADA
ncbi:DUF58 domain-containing protein [Thiosocius teredinicola]|uniref:DUF58 domain-containing protein n=1 Tax=Thiosocius teredinicola TaxID=1973002 RepID=UPI000990D773